MQYNTFKELFDNHILYSYEIQYGVSIGSSCVPGKPIKNYIAFHKLTIFDDGTLNYKGVTETYDKRLWPRVEQFAQMLIETPGEKLLFKNKKSSQHDVEES